MSGIKDSPSAASLDLSKQVEVLYRETERHAQQHKRKNLFPANGFKRVVRTSDKRIAIENLKYKPAFRPAKPGSKRLRPYLNVLLTDEFPTALTEDDFTVHLDRHSRSPAGVMGDDPVPFVYNRQKNP